MTEYINIVVVFVRPHVSSVVARRPSYVVLSRPSVFRRPSSSQKQKYKYIGCETKHSLLLVESGSFGAEKCFSGRYTGTLEFVPNVAL